jgi:hypothetical protein
VKASKPFRFKLSPILFRIDFVFTKIDHVEYLGKLVCLLLFFFLDVKSMWRSRWFTATWNRTQTTRAACDLSATSWSLTTRSPATTPYPPPHPPPLTTLYVSHQLLILLHPNFVWAHKGCVLHACLGLDSITSWDPAHRITQILVERRYTTNTCVMAMYFRFIENLHQIRPWTTRILAAVYFLPFFRSRSSKFDIPILATFAPC